MPWTYYNPHPKGKNVTDCVKRAICAVTGEDYMEIQRELNRTKKCINPIYNGYTNDSFRSIGVRNTFAENRGWKQVMITKDRYDFEYSPMDTELFCHEHPKGKYILQCENHWVGCVDGMLYDTFDSTGQPITYYWVVEEGV